MEQNNAGCRVIMGRNWLTVMAEGDHDRSSHRRETEVTKPINDMKEGAQAIKARRTQNTEKRALENMKGW